MVVWTILQCGEGDLGGDRLYGGGSVVVWYYMVWNGMVVWCVEGDLGPNRLCFNQHLSQ